MTSIEAICQEGLIYSIVRGYEKAHRLQRAKRTRTFLNMKDSEIAEQVAEDAGLEIGTVEETSVAHDHIAQVAQTDWDFLQQRAREIGYETGVVGGKFFFRKASGRKDSGGGGLLGDIVDTLAASMLGLGGKLTFKDNLRTFLPRLSAANLTPDVEVRVWDPKDARVAVAKVDAATGTASIKDQDPAKLAKSFTDGLISLPSLPAHAVDSRPAEPQPRAAGQQHRLPRGGSATRRRPGGRHRGGGGGQGRRRPHREHVRRGGGRREGRPEDPGRRGGRDRRCAGTVLRQVVRHQRAARVRPARERLPHAVLGVRPAEPVTARADLRWRQGTQQTGFGGLVCGIVTNVSDKENLGRVKVALPWLAPNFESDWARVVQFGAGARTGALFLPSVGDEVLVGFEFGDSRRPYVLGGLINSKSDYGELKKAVDGFGARDQARHRDTGGEPADVHRRAAAGPAGEPAADRSRRSSWAPRATSSASSSTRSPARSRWRATRKPPESKSPNGALTIECGELGGITIKGGTGGVKIETDGQLSLNGKMGVKIESSAIVEVKGSSDQAELEQGFP